MSKSVCLSLFLLIIAGCGAQSSPEEQTQESQKKAVSQPAPSEKAAVDASQTVQKKTQPDGDQVVEKILSEHHAKRIQTALHDLRSQNRDQRVMAVATLVTSKADPNQVVAALLKVVDDQDEQLAEMARDYIQSRTFQSRGLLVDFYADWCGPCRLMKPVVKELQDEGYPVVQVDVDQHRDLSQYFYITSIPTFAVIVDGSMQKRRVGVVSKADLLELIKKIPQEKKKDQKKLLVTDPKLKVYGLLLAMSSDKPWLRYEAVQQLVSQSGTSLPQLIQILRDPEQGKVFRQSAIKALEAFMESQTGSEEVISAMTEMMHDNSASAELKGAAVIFLSRHVPEQTSELNAELIKVLKRSQEEELQRAAALEVGRNKITEGLPVLLGKLKNLNEASTLERMAYLEALGYYGAQAEAAVPELLSAYRSQPDDGDLIAETLELICLDSKTATDQLIQALSDENAELRAVAISILDQAEYITQAFPALRKLLKDEDPEVSKKAAALLIKIGGSDQQIVSAMLGMLDQENVDWEVQSVFQTAWRHAIPELVQIICEEQSPEQMKLNALTLLRQSYHALAPVEQASLKAALDSADPLTKQCAALAISSTDTSNQKMVALLLEAFKSENEILRRESIRSLRQHFKALSDPQQKQFTKALIELLSASDQSMADYAADALQQLTLSAAELKQLLGLLKITDSQYLVLSVLSTQHEIPSAAIAPLLSVLQEGEAEEDLINKVSELLGRVGKPALDGLEKILSDSEVDVEKRAGAARAIGAIAKNEPSVAPLLRKLLKQDEVELQIVAATELAGQQQDIKTLMPLLLAGMQSENWECKRTSEEALLEILMKSIDALDETLTAIDQMEPEKQSELLLTLFRMDVKNDQLQQRLIPLIQNLSQEKDHYTRLTAIRFLIREDKSGSEIVKLLSEPDEKLVQQTLSTLNSSEDAIPAAVVPRLEPFLKSSYEQTRLLAALCLLKSGAQEETLVSIVSKALQSADQEVQNEAISGLDSSNALDARLVPTLITLLKDRSSRTTAIDLLGQMGEDAKPALPELMELLETVSYYPDAAHVLEQLGVSAAPAIPALRAKLTNERTIQAAAHALAKIEQDHRATIAILAQNLDQPDLRGASCTCLAYFAEATPDAVEPLLLKVARSEEFYDRGLAISALGSLKTKAAVQQLVIVLEDKNKTLASRAARALGELRIEADLAVPALMKFLEDQDQQLSFAAARALGAFGPAAQPAIPALLKLLDQEQFRVMAARALGDIGAPAEGTIPRLIKMLDDDQTRRAAVEGLRNFGPLAKEALPRLKSLEENSNGYELRQIQLAIRAIEKTEETNPRP